MSTLSSFKKSNAGVRRIMQEARELANDPSTDYTAAPLEDNLFEWHCTLRGAPETEFEGGLYHFRIVLPAEYPFRPPSLMMLTPSGRFEINTKLCISFTNYHEELWQPAWGVRTAIIGLQGFFPLKGESAVGVGALEAPASERRRLAKLSRDWVCPQCKVPNVKCLPDPDPQPTTQIQSCFEANNGCSAFNRGQEKVDCGTNATITVADGLTGMDSRSEESPGERGAKLSDTVSSAATPSGSGSMGKGVEEEEDGEEEKRMIRIRDESQPVLLGGEKWGDTSAEDGRASERSSSSSSPNPSLSFLNSDLSGADADERPRVGFRNASSNGSDPALSFENGSCSNGPISTQTRVQMQKQAQGQAESSSPSSTLTGTSSRPPRPPLILDATISVLLVLVAALLCRKVL